MELLALRFTLPALPEEVPHVELPLPLTIQDPSVPKQLTTEPASETVTVAFGTDDDCERTRSAPPTTLSVPEKSPPELMTRLPLPPTVKVPFPIELKGESSMVPELDTGDTIDPVSPERINGPPPKTTGLEPVI
jgi:hypothetical protein